MISRYLILILSAILAVASSSAQNSLRRSGGPQQRPSNRNVDMKADTPSKQDTVRTGSAWTLTFPLGNHVETTIDTLSYNFQRSFIPSQITDAYATTGNVGAEGIDLIFFNRPQRSTFFFRMLSTIGFLLSKSRNSTICMSRPQYFRISSEATNSIIRTGSELTLPEM